MPQPDPNPLKKVDDQFVDIQPGPQPLPAVDADGKPINQVSTVRDYGDGLAPGPLPAHEEIRLREEQLAQQQALAAQQNQGVPPSSDDRGGIAQMKKRIDKLVWQKRTAEEETASVMERLQVLENKNAELMAQLAQGRPEPGPAPNLPTQLSYPGFPQPQPQQQMSPAAQAGVPQDQVLQALQNLNERMNRREQMEALEIQQERSWNDTVAEFPELKDPQSQLRTVAADLFQRDPQLRMDPNGPYRATVMARGIITDVPRQEARLEASRQAASTPQGTAFGAAGTTRAQVEKQYNEVLDRMSRGIGNSLENWKEASALRRQLTAPQ